jgi:hypothetical protein
MSSQAEKKGKKRLEEAMQTAFPDMKAVLMVTLMAKLKAYEIKELYELIAQLEGKPKDKRDAFVLSMIVYPYLIGLYRSCPQLSITDEQFINFLNILSGGKDSITFPGN